MHDFDLDIDPQEPTLGLYVRKGAGLPDLSDSEQWAFDFALSPSGNCPPTSCKVSRQTGMPSGSSDDP
jgi:hypothetical protein